MGLLTMPVFLLLLILAAVLIWAFASALFKPIGMFIQKILKDAQDNMSDTQNTSENTKEIHL